MSLVWGFGAPRRFVLKKKCRIRPSRTRKGEREGYAFAFDFGFRPGAAGGIKPPSWCRWALGSWSLRRSALFLLKMIFVFRTHLVHMLKGRRVLLRLEFHQLLKIIRSYRVGRAHTAHRIQDQSLALHGQAP